MKILLIVTAVIEAGAGLALIALPSQIISILLGSSLDSPAGLTLGRVAGAALVALGAACWLARREVRGGGATSAVAAMLLYNVAVAAILASAGIGDGLRGVGLWPAVGLHTAMAVWCVACLQRWRA